MLLFFTEISSFSLKVLIGLVALSLVIPYFWCRYLCPYGALLGVLSLASPLKVTRHAKACIDCNLCNQACPSLLPVDRLERVSSDECVGCLSCVAACPAPEALQLETPRFWRRAVRPTVFAALVVVLFFGGIQAAKLAGYWQTDITDAEYRKRAAEINSPKYHHAQGEVPPYTPED
jgi:polyferredoxin